MSADDYVEANDAIQGPIRFVLGLSCPGVPTPMSPDVINLALALMIEAVPSLLSFDMAGSEAIEIGALASLCVRVAGRGRGRRTARHDPG